MHVSQGTPQYQQQRDADQTYVKSEMGKVILYVAPVSATSTRITTG
jgi:hypothetical protein